MAVSISTITKSVGWARSDVILALEEAFDFVNFHGDSRSGIVTFVTARNGGQLTSNSDDYFDVEASTTSGIGTGASFDIFRNSGSINQIRVNRPGYGYTDGEYLTFDPSLIGGVSATGLGITVSVAGRSSPTSYGSTTTFYQKHVGVGSEFPFGVLRHEIESGKKYGDTYRGIQVWSDYQLLFTVGNGFHPYSPKYDPIADISQNAFYNTSDGASAYQYRYAGKWAYDLSSNSSTDPLNSSRTCWFNVSSTDFYSNANSASSTAFATNQISNVNGVSYNSYVGYNLKYASSNTPTTHDLVLTVYQSSIDPKFSIFSFSQPSVAGSSIDENVFVTWFYHNYTSNLWDYDYVYNSALTLIKTQRCTNTSNGNYSRINLDTYTNGNFFTWNYQSSPHTAMENRSDLRTAHLGYTQSDGYTDTNPRNTFANMYESTVSGYSLETNNVNSGEPLHTLYQPGPAAIYSRRSAGIKSLGPNGETAPAELDYNAVIKGIPVCYSMIPCPYYLPDDFVLIDFRYTTSDTNITQGDTITISGSEVYEVITASYNQYTETSGIALCARRV
jgi:hypothetical protein